MTVTPTAAYPAASITVNDSPVVSGNGSGTITLNIGSNVITTVVVSEDLSQTNTYTLTATRLGSSITLWWDGGSADIDSNGDGVSEGGAGDWNRHC